MRFLCIILSAVQLTLAGSVEIDPLPVEGNPQECGEYLQYDDGSAYWFSWDGLYRGVWFNMDDFLPAMNMKIEFTEYWMYHDAANPWDISDFYAELWEGDSQGPVTLEDQQQLTALHYAPVYSYVYSQEWLSDFWPIENTQLSSGGWPSVMGDGSPPTFDHSFYSNDFQIWTPWSDGTSKGDFFIRVEGCINPGCDLAVSTWGAIKAVF
jgi:hypothetical protein